MLDSLITSRTRVKLLLKFFLNSSTTSYLRNLETEFGESTNAIRVELNRLEEAGLLVSGSERNRRIFRANITHPLFPDISSLIRKYVGIDQLIEQILQNLGDVEQVYLTGKLARGIDSQDIHMLIVGHDIDVNYLDKLIQKAAKVVTRRIYYTITPAHNAPSILAETPDALLIFEK